ncbi:MMPL family transporter [Rhodanobacter sp. AS-Z3]|uniref:MMPL family transporter n=1 Tax=Rhodanobacter sp. AS-Z3 TaxID=3031330 RepID=UPI002479D529|nr:MMPL family transporter [Rhodanobacter sp. AS-Z3]WEN15336.1 MMPL family transporter [Rhodanobacter sp. AS-Z3]
MGRGARATLLVLWLLALAGLGWMVAQRLKISTDLRSFMPAPTTPDQRLLMEQVGEGPGSRLLLLSISRSCASCARGAGPSMAGGGASDEKLAALSQGLAGALKKDPRYSQVINGSFDLGALDPSLLPYRFLLSPTLDTQPLDEAYLADQLQQRLDDLSSPAASLLKGLLPRDPTLEVLKLAQLWAPAKSPEVREGVWFSPQNEALLLVQTVAAGFDPGAQEQSIDGIRKAFAALPDSASAKLELSGPGYFSVVVGAQTRHQADWIGRISTVGFIALLLLAYRSFSSLLLGALPIASAALAGIAVLTLAFPEVHGITLAFGFTLLGVAQEYPIRVLSHRRAGEDAVQSVRDLWPLLLTAIASACIAYLAFYASGVNGLKQLAVFTIVGLLVAGFSTRYLLPHLLPRRVRDVADMAWLVRARHFVDHLPRPRWIPLLVAVAIVAMLGLARGSFWQNNLAALTPLPLDLLQHDARLRQALGAPDVRYLLVLQAPTEQGVLTLSEQLQPQVDALVAKHAVDALELPSRYLPSVAVQRARQQKLPDHTTLQHALDEALQGLPFRAELFQPFVADVETARQLAPLTPQRYAQTPLGQRLAAMLMQRDGHWLGLGTVSGVHDVAALQALGKDSHGSVRLLDLKAASESLVVDYRTRILQALLAASLLLVLTITFALRSVRRAWHVLAPMTLATFLVLAVERMMGIEISLFHLVALILAGGLGLHYALFFERDTGDPAEQRRTLHATIVCVLSALLVFGMLAWATIPVLRAIGLTVSLGVAFHFCLSILMAPHVAED